MDAIKRMTVLAAAVLSAGPASAVDIYSTFAPVPGTPGDGLEPFVERLRQVSGLHFGIKTAADLGVDQSQLLSLVAHGAIDMAIVVPIIQDRGSEERNVQVDLYGESFPFGLQLEEYLSWHYDGGGLALLEEILAADGDGVIMFPVLAEPGQSAGMFIAEVSRNRFQSNSPAFRMRSFGWGQEVLRLAYPNMQFHFAVPGASGPDDILAAFAGGLIDGAEFLYPRADLTLFVADPLPNVIDFGVRHYYITAWQSPATVQYLAIHRPFFERLNARKQEQLRLAAQASTQDTYSRNLQAQGQALKELRDAGLTIGSLPEEVLTDLRAATEAVLEQTAMSNATFRRVLDSLKSFVREQRTWQERGHVAREFRFEVWGSDWAADVPVEIE